jgi:excisionase family DNA binding protein
MNPYAGHSDQQIIKGHLMLIENNLLNRDEAANYLNQKTNTLAVWACNKRYDLPYIKIGRRVLYKKSDLDAFIAANRVGGC